MLNSGQSSSFNRRRFLGLLGSFAGGAYLLESPLAQAQDAEKSFNIPAEWMTEEVIRYAKYIGNLKLKHITPEMVLTPHFKEKDGVRNSIPPRKLWRKIKPTLQVIDQLASRLGDKPPELLKVYRSPRFNRAMKGKSRSQHLQNTAVRMKFDLSSKIVAQELRKMRAEGLFKGGVGQYSESVHIDTRGHNADW